MKCAQSSSETSAGYVERNLLPVRKASALAVGVLGELADEDGSRGRLEEIRRLADADVAVRRRQRPELPRKSEGLLIVWHVVGSS